MRALLQRVTRAEVRAGDEVVGLIGAGFVVLLGVGPGDDESTADALARQVAELRIFRDDEGRTNRSLLDVVGAALVVSQFTLFADTRRESGYRQVIRRIEKQGRQAVGFCNQLCDTSEFIRFPWSRGRVKVVTIRTGVYVTMDGFEEAIVPALNELRVIFRLPPFPLRRS